MSEQIRELARQWFDEVWNQQRSDTIERMVAPACLGHHEGQTTNNAGEIKAMRDQLLGLLPDLRVEIEDIVADERHAVVRWTFSGTSSAGAKAPVSFSGMTWLTFSDGKIVEGWDRWNQAAFLQQLAL